MSYQHGAYIITFYVEENETIEQFEGVLQDLVTQLRYVNLIGEVVTIDDVVCVVVRLDEHMTYGFVADWVYPEATRITDGFDRLRVSTRTQLW